ncbi:gamma-glutamyltranspeptidase / glutathione hydrolase / leukotriene-C4 hydrolase [Nematocida sp. LUAm3]|nr:gamma-glutamyltranspeptidase / glutathione hydrolase / leukotriene-C4 hydrolase [Nematocida sp. LUAm3]KAI5173763.1 gamma-glutamyltranspeptidase / glutathione hydrolase / leukotriene-C4 hydrolase [Nematocida sp. LUAm2]KAI5176986.1 gamma-glutamyltranspeptidase / glutathione hydrolase / leukotriene-C4 hydrolase [Nematocida sp. LUAm1]
MRVAIGVFLLDLVFGSSSFYSGYAVTSDLKESSEVGARILKRGGNAVDAAIATALDVGAINAFASGIGGGGFFLLLKTNLFSEKNAYGFNFRETAPASIEMRKYKKQEQSRRGSWSIGIPGEIKGMFLVHKKHGKLPWKSLFEETIQKMENGFFVPPILARKLREYKSVIMKDPGLKEIYVKEERVVEEGEVIKRENLARTLRKIAEDPESFHSGEIARRICEFLNRNEEVITMDDMEAYKAEETAPIKMSIPQRDIDIFGLSVPASGYFLSAGIYILSSLSEEYEKISENRLQTILAAVYRKLYGIRKKLEDLKETKKNEKKIKDILKRKNLDQMKEKIIMEIEEEEKEPKKRDESNFLVDHGTTHINVIDQEGMMVSFTTTINNYWGSGMMDPETGIILNNQLDDFVFKDFMNLSGLQATEHSANLPAKWKRPLSSACPSILRVGSKYYVTGGSGGIRIPSAMLSVLSRILFEKKSCVEAIDHPRLHTQDDQIVQVERTYPDIPFLKNYKVLVDAKNSITSCVHILLVSASQKEEIQAITDKRKKSSSSGGHLERLLEEKTIFSPYRADGLLPLDVQIISEKIR